MDHHGVVHNAAAARTQLPVGGAAETHHGHALVRGVLHVALGGIVSQLGGGQLTGLSGLHMLSRKEQGVAVAAGHARGHIQHIPEVIALSVDLALPDGHGIAARIQIHIAHAPVPAAVDVHIAHGVDGAAVHNQDGVAEAGMDLGYVGHIALLVGGLGIRVSGDAVPVLHPVHQGAPLHADGREIIIGDRVGVLAGIMPVAVDMALGVAAAQRPRGKLTQRVIAPAVDRAVVEEHHGVIVARRDRGDAADIAQHGVHRLDLGGIGVHLHRDIGVVDRAGVVVAVAVRPGMGGIVAEGLSGTHLALGVQAPGKELAVRPQGVCGMAAGEDIHDIVEVAVAALAVIIAISPGVVGAVAVRAGVGVGVGRAHLDRAVLIGPGFIVVEIGRTIQEGIDLSAGAVAQLTVGVVAPGPHGAVAHEGQSKVVAVDHLGGGELHVGGLGQVGLGPHREVEDAGNTGGFVPDEQGHLTEGVGHGPQLKVAVGAVGIGIGPLVEVDRQDGLVRGDHIKLTQRQSVDLHIGHLAHGGSIPAVQLEEVVAGAHSAVGLIEVGAHVQIAAEGILIGVGDLIMGHGGSKLHSGIIRIHHGGGIHHSLPVLHLDHQRQPDGVALLDRDGGGIQAHGLSGHTVGQVPGHQSAVQSAVLKGRLRRSHLTVQSCDIGIVGDIESVVIPGAHKDRLLHQGGSHLVVAQIACKGSPVDRISDITRTEDVLVPDPCSIPHGAQSVEGAGIVVDGGLVQVHGHHVGSGEGQVAAHIMRLLALAGLDGGGHVDRGLAGVIIGKAQLALGVVAPGVDGAILGDGRRAVAAGIDPGGGNGLGLFVFGLSRRGGAREGHLHRLLGIIALGVAVSRDPLAHAKLAEAVIAPGVDRAGGIQGKDVAVAHGDVHDILEVVGAVELVAGADLHRVDPAQVGPVGLVVITHGAGHTVPVRSLPRRVGVGGAGVTLIAPGVDGAVAHQGHRELIAGGDLGDPGGIVGGGKTGVGRDGQGAGGLVGVQAVVAQTAGAAGAENGDGRGLEDITLVVIGHIAHAAAVVVNGGAALGARHAVACPHGILETAVGIRCAAAIGTVTVIGARAAAVMGTAVGQAVILGKVGVDVVQALILAAVAPVLHSAVSHQSDGKVPAGRDLDRSHVTAAYLHGRVSVGVPDSGIVHPVAGAGRVHIVAVAIPAYVPIIMVAVVVGIGISIVICAVAQLAVVVVAPGVHGAVGCKGIAGVVAGSDLDDVAQSAAAAVALLAAGAQHLLRCVERAQYTVAPAVPGGGVVLSSGRSHIVAVAISGRTAAIILIGSSGNTQLAEDVGAPGPHGAVGLQGQGVIHTADHHGSGHAGGGIDLQLEDALAHALIDAFSVLICDIPAQQVLGGLIDLEDHGGGAVLSPSGGTENVLAGGIVTAQNGDGLVHAGHGHIAQGLAAVAVGQGVAVAVGLSFLHQGVDIGPGAADQHIVVSLQPELLVLIDLIVPAAVLAHRIGVGDGHGAAAAVDVRAVDLKGSVSPISGGVPVGLDHNIAQAEIPNGAVAAHHRRIVVAHGIDHAAQLVGGVIAPAPEGAVGPQQGHVILAQRHELGGGHVARVFLHLIAGRVLGGIGDIGGRRRGALRGLAGIHQNRIGGIDGGGIAQLAVGVIAPGQDLGIQSLAGHTGQAGLGIGIVDGSRVSIAGVGHLHVVKRIGLVQVDPHGDQIVAASGAIACSNVVGAIRSAGELAVEVATPGPDLLLLIAGAVQTLLVQGLDDHSMIVAGGDGGDALDIVILALAAALQSLGGRALVGHAVDAQLTVPVTAPGPNGAVALQSHAGATAGRDHDHVVDVALAQITQDLDGPGHPAAEVDRGAHLAAVVGAPGVDLTVDGQSHGVRKARGHGHKDHVLHLALVIGRLDGKTVGISAAVAVAAVAQLAVAIVAPSPDVAGHVQSHHMILARGDSLDLLLGHNGRSRRVGIRGIHTGSGLDKHIAQIDGGVAIGIQVAAVGIHLYLLGVGGHVGTDGGGIVGYRVGGAVILVAALGNTGGTGGVALAQLAVLVGAPGPDVARPGQDGGKVVARSGVGDNGVAALLEVDIQGIHILTGDHLAHGVSHQAVVTHHLAVHADLLILLGIVVVGRSQGDSGLAGLVLGIRPHEAERHGVLRRVDIVRADSGDVAVGGQDIPFLTVSGAEIHLQGIQSKAGAVVEVGVLLVDNELFIGAQRDLRRHSVDNAGGLEGGCLLDVPTGAGHRAGDSQLMLSGGQIHIIGIVVHCPQTGGRAIHIVLNGFHIVHHQLHRLTGAYGHSVVQGGAHQVGQLAQHGVAVFIGGVVAPAPDVAEPAVQHAVAGVVGIGAVLEVHVHRQGVVIAQGDIVHALQVSVLVVMLFILALADPGGNIAVAVVPGTQLASGILAPEVSIVPLGNHIVLIVLKLGVAVLDGPHTAVVDAGFHLDNVLLLFCQSGLRHVLTVHNGNYAGARGQSQGGQGDLGRGSRQAQLALAVAAHDIQIGGGLIDRIGASGAVLHPQDQRLIVARGSSSAGLEELGSLMIGALLAAEIALDPGGHSIGRLTARLGTDSHRLSLIGGGIAVAHLTILIPAPGIDQAVGTDGHSVMLARFDGHNVRQVIIGISRLVGAGGGAVDDPSGSRLDQIPAGTDVVVPAVAGLVIVTLAPGPHIALAVQCQGEVGAGGDGHDLGALRQSHLHRQIPVGGIAHAQLTLVVVAPGPDCAVLVQSQVEVATGGHSHDPGQIAVRSGAVCARGGASPHLNGEGALHVGAVAQLAAGALAPCPDGAVGPQEHRVIASGLHHGYGGQGLLVASGYSSGTAVTILYIEDEGVAVMVAVFVGVIQSHGSGAELVVPGCPEGQAGVGVGPLGGGQAGIHNGDLHIVLPCRQVAQLGVGQEHVEAGELLEHQVAHI